MRFTAIQTGVPAALLSAAFLLTTGVAALRAEPPAGAEWVMVPEMSDEFEGKDLDPAKWRKYSPVFVGRQPAFFMEKNVKVRKGKLQITALPEDPPENAKAHGFHSFTTGLARTIGRLRYGYFEARTRPMDTNFASGFWLYAEDSNMKTEIDIHELCGGPHRFSDRYFMNLHVFRLPETGENHKSVKAEVQLTFRPVEDFHTYGCEWDEESISWFVDGERVYTEPNVYWHQSLHIHFDAETHPGWFGTPKTKTVPATYHIDWVRTWQKKGSTEKVRMTKPGES